MLVKQYVTICMSNIARAVLLHFNGFIYFLNCLKCDILKPSSQYISVYAPVRSGNLCPVDREEPWRKPDAFLYSRYLLPDPVWSKILSKFYHGLFRVFYGLWQYIPGEAPLTLRCVPVNHGSVINQSNNQSSMNEFMGKYGSITIKAEIWRLRECLIFKCLILKLKKLRLKSERSKDLFYIITLG